MPHVLARSRKMRSSGSYFSGPVCARAALDLLAARPRHRRQNNMATAAKRRTSPFRRRSRTTAHPRARCPAHENENLPNRGGLLPPSLLAFIEPRGPAAERWSRQHNIARNVGCRGQIVARERSAPALIWTSWSYPVSVRPWPISSPPDKSQTAFTAAVPVS